MPLGDRAHRYDHRLHRPGCPFALQQALKGLQSLATEPGAWLGGEPRHTGLLYWALSRPRCAESPTAPRQRRTRHSAGGDAAEEANAVDVERAQGDLGRCWLESGS